MKYRSFTFSVCAALSVMITVTAVFFLGCGNDLRHIAGEERDDYDPGETGEDFVRIGSFMKPVDTEWRYRVIKGSETYEIEVIVIAVTDNSYKLRERRDGYPDIEYYYEFGREVDGFTTISVFEEYEVGGKRVTYRYSPHKKYLPANGVLRKGLSWRDGGIMVEEIAIGRRERHTCDFEAPGTEYNIESVYPLETPASEYITATMVKSSGGLLLERRYVSNIGTVKTVTYDNNGSVTETRELLDYSFPERDFSFE